MSTGRVWWIILLTSRLKMCEIVDYNLIIQRGMDGAKLSHRSMEEGTGYFVMFTHFSLTQNTLLAPLLLL